MGSLLSPSDFDVSRWQPSGLVVDLTRTCNEQCLHCIVAASPHHRNTISEANLVRGIRDAKDNHILSVSFYGGEPFTRKDILYKGIRETLWGGMTPQVMTNGFWGINDEKTDKTLSELESLGAQHGKRIEINLSTDEFHKRVPLSSIVRIIKRWILKDDIQHVSINLSVGTGITDQSTILEQLFNELEDNEHACCGIVDNIEMSPTSGSNIRFCKKNGGTIFSRSVPLDEFKSFLLREGIINSSEEDCLGDSTQTALLFIRSNNLARLVQLPEDKEKNQFRIFKFHSKKVGWTGGYDFKLLGAGESLQNDPEWIERVATRRRESNYDLRRHEGEELVLLGLDNKFYLSPSQLHYQISPLGENTGHELGGVIQRVRMRHPIADIIIRQDYRQARMYGISSLGYGDNTLGKAEDLAGKGLSYEALYLLLRNTKIQETLMGPWNAAYGKS